MARQVLITNLSGSDVELEDLGYIVASAASGLDLLAEGFDPSELRKSEDLNNALSAATPLLYAEDENGQVLTSAYEIIRDLDIEFRDLYDTPSSYSGAGSKYARIKSTEDGVEVATPDASEISYNDVSGYFAPGTDTVAEALGQTVAPTPGSEPPIINAALHKFFQGFWPQTPSSAVNLFGGYDNSNPEVGGAFQAFDDIIVQVMRIQFYYNTPTNKTIRMRLFKYDALSAAGSRVKLVMMINQTIVTTARYYAFETETVLAPGHNYIDFSEGDEFFIRIDDGSGLDTDPTTGSAVSNAFAQFTVNLGYKDQVGS